jgi:hypothetical protein
MTKRQSVLKRSREVAGATENCRSDRHWAFVPGSREAMGGKEDGEIRCLTLCPLTPVVAGPLFCRLQQHVETKPLPAGALPQQDLAAARAAQHLQPGMPQQRFTPGVARFWLSGPPQPHVPSGRLATGTKAVLSQISAFAASLQAVCISMIIDILPIGAQSVLPFPQL